jgi:hypothetical protein
MMRFLERRRFAFRAPLALAAAAVAVLLAGCGGGGGGGSSSGGGGGTPKTVTITGTLQDKSTGILLPNRTVTVRNTSLSGTTNTQGQFSIGSVPVTTITLDVKDSTGTSDGSSSAIDLSKISGTTRNVGTIQLDVSGTSPPPPPTG